jgi:hypothetical protein
MFFTHRFHAAPPFFRLTYRQAVWTARGHGCRGR